MAQQLDLFYDYLGMPREETPEEKASKILNQLSQQQMFLQSANIANPLAPEYQRIQCCG